jgi:hypothetical protein
MAVRFKVIPSRFLDDLTSVAKDDMTCFIQVHAINAPSLVLFAPKQADRRHYVLGHFSQS